jgi:methionyl-tRNA synthetase
MFLWYYGRNNKLKKMVKPIVEYGDFEKLDLRVGKVIEAGEPAWSNKLIEMKIDFGAEIGSRTIFAGIRKFVNFADLIGNKYVFIVNLAERKLGEGISQGMMLVVGDEANHFPLRVDDAIVPGAAIR